MFVYYCQQDAITSLSDRVLQCRDGIVAASPAEFQPLFSQLEALTRFDPASVAQLMGGYLVFFISGAAVGHVIRLMRRV